MNPSDETVEYIYCSSATLLSAPAQSTSAETVVLSTQDEILDALETKFDVLVDAYEKTGISVYKVGVNTGEVRKYINMLLKANRVDFGDKRGA